MANTRNKQETFEAVRKLLQGIKDGFAPREEAIADLLDDYQWHFGEHSDPAKASKPDTDSKGYYTGYCQCSCEKCTEGTEHCQGLICRGD